MGRPSKGGEQVNVRLPEDEIAQLEQWAEELRASGALGSSGVTRSDLIRDIVMQATAARREAIRMANPPRGAAKTAQKGKAKR